MTKHEFQAQVSEVLRLVIHSLYSNPEIFLRELLSNASDALDKERFLAISSPDEAAGESAQQELGIRLSADPESRTLTISDNGLGMSEAELIEHLGTVAHSGSREFLKKLSEQKDLSLIGQFGVGFYSAFLVADKVRVVSRKRGQDQAFAWESTGDNGFTTEPAERAGRGTTIILYLKEEQQEFLDAYRLRELVTRYSDYVAYPISLAEKVGEEQEFKRINQASALWQRKPSEVTEEQYEEFYKHLSSDYRGPLAHQHFRVEGTQEFTGLLFVPREAPFDLFQPEGKHGVRLHVKRVFIMDDCEDLLPKWLRFVRGVVDSEDLPLNVSRELLQDSKVVRTIRKQVVKQILDLLEKLASEKPEDYLVFWNAFGAVLKEGLHFDPEYRERLAKLVRYESSRAEGLTSLEDYVKRMPEAQKQIYYILGSNKRTVDASPHIEALRSRGFEVLYMTDPVDEWAVRGLREFEGKQVVSVMEDKLELPNQDKKAEDAAAEQKESEELAPLFARAKQLLESKIKEVRATSRLTDSPACLVIPEGGLAPYIERLLRVQQGEDLPVQKRILELNPKHPLVLSLSKLAQNEPESPKLGSTLELLFDQALLAEGSPLEDPARLAKHLASLLTSSMQAS